MNQKKGTIFSAYFGRYEKIFKEESKSCPDEKKSMIAFKKVIPCWAQKL